MLNTMQDVYDIVNIKKIVKFNSKALPKVVEVEAAGDCYVESRLIIDNLQILQTEKK